MAMYSFASCSKYFLNVYKISRIARRTNFYVLLPEVPPDTPDTNPLLAPNNSTPPFTQLTATQFYNAALKRFLEFEKNLFTLEEDIFEGKTTKNFSSILEPLDQYNHEIDSVWNVLRNYYLVRQTDAMSKTYFSLISRYHRTKYQQYSSLILYNAVMELEAGGKLTEAQKQLVQKFLLECRMNGIELSDTKRKKLGFLHNKITTIRHQISSNLEASLKNYSRMLESPQQVKDFPDSLLRLLAVDKSKPHQGPWQATLHTAAYNGVLQYSSDRDLRRSLYVASVTRCWRNDSQLSVSLPIEYIRDTRTQLAQLLGYETYAHFSMKTKMAGSVDNVTEFLTRLREHCQPQVGEELAKLQDYAQSQGADYGLDLYDIPYWQHKHKQALYSLDDIQVSQYFPFPHVLQGIFQLFQNLFGLTFQECTSEVDVWDPHVSYYRVKDEDGKPLGSFYLDPYHRPKHKMGGTWLSQGSGRCDAIGCLPVAFLNCNLTPPHGPSHPSLLTFQQVSELLKRMGQVVQLGATKAPYSQLNGLNAVPLELVDLWPNLAPRWLLSDHSVAGLLSHHVTSGDSLPQDLHSRLLASTYSYMPHYSVLQETYLADLDLALYLRQDHWADIAMAKWQQYQPFPMGEKYHHVSQFSEVLSGRLAASYYSRLWSQMLAADLGAWLKGQEDSTAVRRLRDGLLLNPSSTQDLYQYLRGQPATLQPFLDSLKPLSS